MHRQFCPTCGTPVFTQNEARLHMVGVRAGTLDDPDVEKTADDHLDFKRAELGRVRPQHPQR
jgi:hypothetical protein